MNPILIILGSSGLIMLLAGSVLRLYPPKNINWLYGYRTKRSMQTQESWDFAQRHSSQALATNGMILLALATLSYFAPLASEGLGTFLGLGALLLSSAITISTTERALHKRYPDK